MKNLLISVVMLCILVPALQAQDIYQWFGTSTAMPRPEPTTNWNEGFAWKKELTNTFGTVPGSYDKAKLNNVQWGTNWDQYGPIIGGENGVQNISIGDVFIAEGGAALSPMHMTVAQGGTFNVLGAGGSAQGQINIAYQAGAVGSFIVDGGTVNVNGPVHVGWGGDGTLSINNGTMTVNSIDFGGDPIGTGTGQLYMTGYSQLIIRGYFVPWDPIYPPITGDPYTISYDEVNDWTIISTPEPASIALLGLGLAFFRKQK